MFFSSFPVKEKRDSYDADDKEKIAINWRIISINTSSNSKYCVQEELMLLYERFDSKYVSSFGDNLTYQ